MAIESLWHLRLALTCLASRDFFAEIVFRCYWLLIELRFSSAKRFSSGIILHTTLPTDYYIHRKFFSRCITLFYLFLILLLQLFIHVLAICARDYFSGNSPRFYSV